MPAWRPGCLDNLLRYSLEMLLPINASGTVSRLSRRSASLRWQQALFQSRMTPSRGSRRTTGRQLSDPMASLWRSTNYASRCPDGRGSLESQTWLPGIVPQVRSTYSIINLGGSSRLREPTSTTSNLPYTAKPWPRLECRLLAVSCLKSSPSLRRVVLALCERITKALPPCASRRMVAFVLRPRTARRSLWTSFSRTFLSRLWRSRISRLIGPTAR